ncbi:helix-turn-helix domain-containing protein [Pseudomonas sp. RGM2987]|uniref:winged helix-turn-helix transcriptional regulator n=1 Tax=Pseudomonas sp. RGM2987 TaxID=2930090 RepID=UPI001FD6D89B|nr:helix-turn-helix domain-containing protein [Pseudomonas sp. RGM2987]MCJ8206743.1 helix-turn-helix transcriptional regulator [Pseudomonas sp. RGM2987]
MTNKTYGQLCPIARSLDILGDRWTLLLIREFLLGPKRFKELLAILPAMGTNRLSERLAMLVQNGIIQQVARTPSSLPAYELTDLGEQLRKPILALGSWGLKLPIDERIDPTSARAELIALCLTSAGDPKASAGLREAYEFQVDAEVFHIQVNDGSLLARSGPSAEPVAVRVQCDMATFLALVQGQDTPARALREGDIKLLLGDRQAFTRMFKVLEYKP